MFTVYMSGEIHANWREEIGRGAQAAGLDITFTAPVTDHDASDAAAQGWCTTTDQVVETLRYVLQP